MPETLGPTVLATSFSLVSVSTFIVGTRFYCRHFLVGAVKLYDYLMLFALILTWGIAVINYYQVKYGTGVHFKDQTKDPILSQQNLVGTLKSWYTYQMVYLVDLCAVKFSILIFYRAISSQRSYRISVYVIMAIVAAFTVAMVFVNAFECDKPSDAWSAEILLQGKGSCHDLHPIYYGQAGFNIGSDIVILLLPMPVLRTLHMRRNKRLALIGIFSVGSLAVIASIVRIYALHVWSSNQSDVPYTGATILIWSQIEINVAIISASIPSLKALFSRAFSGTTVAGNSQGYYKYGGQTYSRRRQSQTGLVTSITASFSKSRNDNDVEELVSLPRVHIGSLNKQPSTSSVGKSRHWNQNHGNNSRVHVSQSVVIESTRRADAR
ncbi:hypothetical protein FQN55_003852 [Onygenales sp. PD_40]|nr:hypothetical protein FQN55_003852 [Onygenales sp. PD_40]